MTTDPMHSPTPEFRAHLEWEVTRAFRREASLGNRRFEKRRRRMRIVTVAAVCLALGTVSNFATAQVRDTVRRDSLLDSARSQVELLRLREQVAQKQFEEYSRKAALGVISKEELSAMRAALMEIEAKLVRSALNIAEIQAASLPPRDDLNAPLVKGRDFVKERIETDITRAQQENAAREQALAEVERQLRVGVVGELAVKEAKAESERAQQKVMLSAEKLRLREEYVQKKTPVDQLTSRLDSVQRDLDLKQALLSHDVAATRVQLLQKQYAAGAAAELDLLRAQVELKERELEVLKLQQKTPRLMPKGSGGGS